MVETVRINPKPQTRRVFDTKYTEHFLNASRLKTVEFRQSISDSRVQTVMI